MKVIEHNHVNFRENCRFAIVPSENWVQIIVKVETERILKNKNKKLTNSLIKISTGNIKITSPPPKVLVGLQQTKRHGNWFYDEQKKKK